MCRLALFLPLAAALAVTPAGPLQAIEQTDDYYIQQYNFDAVALGREMETIKDIDKQIGMTTELVAGCKLLDDSLAHYREADRLLTEMVEFSAKMNRRKENKNAVKQQEAVKASIAVKEADVARLCSALPKT